jgi:hypothetical protein
MGASRKDSGAAKLSVVRIRLDPTCSKCSLSFVFLTRPARLIAQALLRQFGCSVADSKHKSVFPLVGGFVAAHSLWI